MMKQAQQRPQIVGDKLDQRETVGAIVDSDTAYNGLAVTHNLLIDYVKDKCQ
jgi:hypothetical protein